VLTALSGTSGGVPQPAHISLDADPSTGRRGLLNNSENYGNYSASDALLTQIPLTLSPPLATSLVAALQRNETEAPGGGTSAIVGERVDAYCIVTVLRSPPAGDGESSLRPNITGATKEFLTWGDFDLSRLGAFHAFPSLTSTALTTITTRWRHSSEIFGYGLSESGIIKVFSEGGRAFRAGNCHDEYGAGMNASLQNDILSLLNTLNTIEQKKPALASILSFALDLYHARYKSANGEQVVFTSGAGQHLGKYGPLLLLAALSTDPAKALKLRELSVQNQGPSPQLLGPQEIRQIRRGVTGVVLWGDGFPFDFGNFQSMPNGNAYRRYWNDLLYSRSYRGQVPYGDPNVGQKTSADPYGYIDGPPNHPGYAYMGIGAAGTQGLAALMILMPRIRDIVNTDAPIEFSDRAVRVGTWAAPDPVAPPPPDLVENIWNPGVFPGATFGVTWGPRNGDIRFPVEDGSGLGRFVTSDWHAKPVISAAYQPFLVRSFWTQIIAQYSGERFEDNLVPVSGSAKPDITVLQGTVHLYHPHPLAILRYTTDGSMPGPDSPIYSQPFALGAGTTIRAFATVPGKTPSAVRTKVPQSRYEGPPANARIQIDRR
jgi:hypothetical protein